ncbi:MAG TPA: hypothetical protein VEL73_03715 [Mycobacteriales bacterium]|nr:hypothetical protein [Mycobacteriales bacterium]
MGSGEWYLAVPAGWRPVPALTAGPLLDGRVVLAEPPGAFRYDVRAVSEPYPAGDGEDYVDVVSEHDWYRSRIRREPVPTSPYRADRVWLEQGELTPAPSEGSPGPAGVFDRLVTPDAPPARPARRASDVPDLTGRRVVVVQPAGPVRHRRAVSEAYLDADGDLAVTICSEHDWYRWAITREPPRAESCPLYLVWVE